MKLFKWLFRILGLVVVVLVIAVGVFAATFDANAYKPEIVAAVKDQTGRELTIDGEIGLTVFPNLGLDLGAVQLSNAQGFGDQPFAAVQDVSVNVAVLPLLRRELVVSKVVLNGLRLDLQRREDGITNWDDLAAAAEPEQPAAPAPAPTEPAPDTTADGPALESLVVGGVEIRDAQVSWRDDQAGQQLAIAPMNLTTGRLEPGKPFPLELDVTVKGAEPAVDLRLELETTANVDVESQSYLLEGLVMALAGSIADLPVDRVELELRGDIDARMAAQQVGIQGLALALRTRGGQFDAADIEMTGEVGADLAAERYTVAALDLKGTVSGADLPGGKATAVVVAGQTEVDLKAQTASLSGLEVRALEQLSMTGQIQATSILDAPAAEGTLRLEPFNPRELMQSLAMEVPETADPKVLNSLGGLLRFNGSARGVNLDKLELDLDDTRLRGAASVEDLNEPAIAFKLAVDEIDADRYLPPPVEGEAAPAAAPAGGGDTGDEEIALPVEELRKLDLDGEVTIGKLKANRLRMEDVDLTITAKQGLLQVRPLTLRMYEGRVHLTSTMDVRGETPKYRVTPKLTGLQVGPLLKDYTGDDKLQGLTEARADLSTTGTTVNALMGALSGSLGASFKDGAIKGFNLRHMIESAEAKLKGRAAPAAELQQTDFSSVSISGKAKKGRINSSDLDFLSPYLRAGGKGWVDLGKSALDYTAKVSVVGTATGQGGESLDDLKGLTIPVRFKGNLDDPDISLALADALKEKQKARLEAEKAKKKKELEAKLAGEKKKEADKVDKQIEKQRDKLKDKLKGFFR